MILRILTCPKNPGRMAEVLFVDPVIILQTTLFGYVVLMLL